MFEGDTRFDMVVRPKRDLREDILTYRKSFHSASLGSKVLSQLADIKTVDAPAQVSREGGKRRVFVGFNVRGRDV
ncbi:MAG: hypothetical protein IPN20_03420 [Haliscomenobacter sp.]|nr:hypothetical protein [Haliscomenobacter sp.]